MTVPALAMSWVAALGRQFDMGRQIMELIFFQFAVRKGKSNIISNLFDFLGSLQKLTQVSNQHRKNVYYLLSS